MMSNGSEPLLTNGAARWASSCSTVTAPESTTSAQGCARAAATASVSTLVAERLRLRSQPVQRRPAIPIGEASVRQHFLDDHSIASRSGLGEGLAGRGLEQVPGGLDGLKERHAVDADREGAADGRRLLRSRDGQADAQPLAAKAGELCQDGAILEHAAFQRRRVNLIQRQARSEDHAALHGLPPQGVEREPLHFMDGRVALPGAGVDVAPLRTDGHRPHGQAPLVAPGAHELFGQTVPTGPCPHSSHQPRARRRATRGTGAAWHGSTDPPRDRPHAPTPCRRAGRGSRVRLRCGSP